MFNFIFAAMVCFTATAEPEPGDLINQAQQRELAYLLAEKTALEAQHAAQKEQHAETIQSIDLELLLLERQLTELKSDVKLSAERLLELEQTQENQSDSALALQSIIEQAGTSDKVETETPDELLAALEATFSARLQAIDSIQKRQIVSQNIFDADGNAVEASVEHWGEIAAFATVNGQTASLRPLGGNDFGWINDWGAATTDGMEIFLFEGHRKRIDETKTKAVAEVLEAGGAVAYVIAALGVLGALLALVRTLILLRANRQPYAQASAEMEKTGRLSVSCEPLQYLWTAEATTHDGLMDIGEAVVMAEKSKLDRFGTAVLVIAAVAPLLGLLGTVTGMIGTFEMITEHGTGDPKMLSGGISEALITTQLGLIVAIPMVLMGNALSAWATRITGRLESAVLNIVARRELQQEKNAS